MRKSTKMMFGASIASLAFWELSRYLKKKRQKNAATVCKIASGVSAGAALLAAVKSNRNEKFARDLGGNVRKNDLWFHVGKNMGEASFFLRHPDVATKVGVVEDRGTNISSIASNFAINSKLPRAVYFNMTDSDKNREIDEGSKRGAYRHALWQAMITKEFGLEIAIEIGNAHDKKLDTSIMVYEDSALIPEFKNYSDADSFVDQLNNIIGRKVAIETKKTTNKELAIAVFNDFLKNGFYIVKELGNENFKAQFTKLSLPEYIKGFETLKKCGEHGLVNE